MARLNPRMKLLLRLINRWKKRLLLDNWSISVEMSNDKVVDNNGADVASIEVLSRYTDARMKVFSSFWDQARELQEATIVHELVHPITNPVRVTMVRAGVPKEKVDDLIEGLTEHFAKALYRAYKGEGSVYEMQPK